MSQPSHERFAQFEALVFLERIQNPTETPEDMSRLRKLCATFLRAGGRASIEACLNAPPTPAKFSKAQRDIWLNRAASTQPEASRHAMALHLSVELKRFAVRGPWRQWCDDSEAPETASDFYKALFWVCRYNHGRTLGQKQIFRILRT